MKITISGIVGSGKSTVARILEKELGLSYHCIGRIMRDMAIKRGISFDELTEIAKTDKSIDLELDERQREMNKNGENFVMDSRLGFHFIPDSIKIFLKIDMIEAARRIYAGKREGEDYSSFGEVLDSSSRRVKSERIRYKQCYDLDLEDESIFDLVIDTTFKGVDEVVKEILDFIKN